MKQKLYSLTASLFTKLALVAALVVGWGNAAMADELTVNGGASNTNKYLPIYVEGAKTFLAKSEYIIPSDLLVSVSNKNITKLSYEVSTKATSKELASYNVYLEETTIDTYPSSGYNFLKSNFATLVYTGTLDATSDIMNIELTSPFNYSGTKNLLVHIECISIGDEGAPYFKGKSDWSNYRGCYLSNSSTTTRTAFVPKTTITYEDASAPTTPHLSITPNEDASFGSVTGDDTKTYTIANSGVGQMTVNISSSNSSEFSVSPSILENIENGSPLTFTITFNHNTERLGNRSAIITVTPTYNGGTPININATATAVDPAAADAILDENEVTTWTTGSQKVLIKYTPKNGWNTFCVPFQARSYMDQIIGSGWQAFALKSYSEGTLTFESANYLGSGTPYLVYIENAANHPEGVLIDNLNLTNTSASYTSNNNVYFRGTYAPKAAGTLTNCYGVTQDGRIAKAGDGATMKGYRAYLTGLPTSGAVKMMVINSDTPTDVGMLQMAEGSDKNVYTLSGQKVKNVTKGLYIMNGKKVVVK